ASLADPELADQSLQTVGGMPHPLGAAGQPAEGMPHVAGCLLHTTDALPVMQAALVELLDDLEHALHPLMQLAVLTTLCLAVLQARIDVLDPRLHALHFAAGFGLQASDQRADVLGRLRRALRQGAYFPGDHGETAPMLTGTGRLDGRIEGQQ